MPRRSETTRKARLVQYLSTLEGRTVGTAEWAELKQQLDPVSDGYLRTLLRRSGHPLAPEVEGVRHDTFEDFERTLTAMPPTRQGRQLVIDSKQRLRWRGGAIDPVRAEMLLWTQTWLENPSLFAGWKALRRRAMADSATESESPRP